MAYEHACRLDPLSPGHWSWLDDALVREASLVPHGGNLNTFSNWGCSMATSCLPTPNSTLSIEPVRTFRLDSTRYRNYHPTLGRWLQRDPASYRDGMSLYQYVGGSPEDYTDPRGLTKPDFEHFLRALIAGRKTVDPQSVEIKGDIDKECNRDSEGQMAQATLIYNCGHGVVESSPGLITTFFVRCAVKISLKCKCLFPPPTAATLGTMLTVVPPLIGSGFFMPYYDWDWATGAKADSVIGAAYNIHTKKDVPRFGPDTFGLPTLQNMQRWTRTFVGAAVALYTTRATGRLTSRTSDVADDLGNASDIQKSSNASQAVMPADLYKWMTDIFYASNGYTWAAPPIPLGSSSEAGCLGSTPKAGGN